MEHIRELVHLSIGRASMCWSEFPRGTFNDEMAAAIANNLIAEIEKQINAITHLSTTTIIRDGQGNEIARRK